MDNEFKTHVLDDVIQQILEKGQLQEVEVSLHRTGYTYHHTSTSAYGVI